MKFFGILLSLTLISSLHASDSNLSSSMKSEKCTLTKSIQAPGNKYAALIGVSSINIYGEWSIMQGSVDVHGKQTFPARDSMISFNFKNDPNKDLVGDTLFNTVQTTSFADKNGKLGDIDKLAEGSFQNLYTHTYKSVKPGRQLTVTAIHSVAQVIDHSASKDVIVDYSDVQTTPAGSTQVKGKFLFKCNQYESALDILK